MPQDALKKLVSGGHLTRAEARTVIDRVMDGLATPAQIGGLLIALRMKGETVEEVAGFAEGMLARVVPVRTRRYPLLDTCGTGGSSFRVFNVSTCAAFVAAAAGIPVAKHGNRAVTSLCGSADVLEALGVRVSITPEQVGECLNDVGIGFLFAPQYHPAMKQVSGPRREIGVRSIFNLVAPLTNPAAATYRAMGVYEPRLCSLATGALRELGAERAIVMHGEIGLDEISTIGRTVISELRAGEVSNYILTPLQLGLSGPEPPPEFLAPGTTAEANAEMVREVLGGKSDTAAAIARGNLVAANAAASLRVYGLAETWPEAFRMAAAILASGKALGVLDRLIALTQTY